MHKKEQSWRQEREEYKNEVKTLKDNLDVAEAAASSANHLASDGGYSVTFTLGSNSFMTTGNHSEVRIQLENAINTADDMQKFNAAIRKEHSTTIDELEKERASLHDSPRQVINLQYHIATLEQESEDAVNKKVDDLEDELLSTKEKLCESQYSISTLELESDDRATKMVANENELFTTKEKLHESQDEVKASKKVKRELFNMEERL